MSHAPRSRVDQLNRGVTEGRVAELVVAGTVAGMKKVYDQLAEENRAMLLEMEGHVVERVLRTLKERSWRWRIARWFGRMAARVRNERATVTLQPSPLAVEPMASPEPDSAAQTVQDGVRKGVIEIVKR